MTYGDVPSIVSRSQSRAGVRCAVCGLILGSVDAPCQNCLCGVDLRQYQAFSAKRECCSTSYEQGYQDGYKQGVKDR